ncbi:MAG TPA: hypothetical protein PKI25_08475, partial [Nitrosomonas europaea]|nr:hypothetical protein [Nitrosomonas europaea]
TRDLNLGKVALYQLSYSRKRYQTKPDSPLDRRVIIETLPILSRIMAPVIIVSIDMGSDQVPVSSK